MYCINQRCVYVCGGETMKEIDIDARIDHVLQLNWVNK